MSALTQVVYQKDVLETKTVLIHIVVQPEQKILM